MSTFSEFVKLVEDYNRHRVEIFQGEPKILQKHHWPSFDSLEPIEQINQNGYLVARGLRIG